MRMAGYTNPLREFERKIAPDYESRVFRDPGLHTSLSSGLGSLHRTMPHLRPAIRLQAGGLDPVGQIYAASRPNLYNPDLRERAVLNAMRTMGTQFRSPAMHAFPFSTATFPYASGGRAEDEDDDTGAPDPEELMEPDPDQAEAQGEEKQIVVEAMLALEGRHPDPEEALKRFVDTFGRDALDELEAMVHEHKEAQAEPADEDNPAADETAPGALGDEGDEDEDMGAAGGGLLWGPGSGQSDEIHGNTPSGRPVLLSDGEYVIDAPTVAALGDGSTNAGARRLDEFRKSVRKQAYGHEKQAKPMASGGRAIVVTLG